MRFDLTLEKTYFINCGEKFGKKLEGKKEIKIRAARNINVDVSGE